MRGLYSAGLVTLLTFQAVGMVGFIAGVDGQQDHREELEGIGDEIATSYMENATSRTERFIGEAMVEPIAYSSEWVGLVGYDIGYKMQWIPGEIVGWTFVLIVLLEMAALLLGAISDMTRR